jgi:hypothetical protein
MEIVCPGCDNEFLATVWEDGSCPACQLKFHWDSFYDYDNDVEDICPIFE